MGSISKRLKKITQYLFLAFIFTQASVLAQSVPSTPVISTLRAIDSNAIYLEWPASTVTGASIYRYNVYRNGALAGTSTTSRFLDKPTTPALIADTSYAYSVVAVDSLNRLSLASATASIKTPPLLQKYLSTDIVATIASSTLLLNTPVDAAAPSPSATPSPSLAPLSVPANTVGTVSAFAPVTANCIVYYYVTFPGIGTGWIAETSLKKLGPVGVNSGDLFVTSNLTTLNLRTSFASAASVYIADNANCAAGGVWQTYSIPPGQLSMNIPHTFPNTEGVQYISVKYKTALNVESACTTRYVIRTRASLSAPSSIYLDPLKTAFLPTSPSRSASTIFSGLLEYQSRSISIFLNNACSGAPKASACKSAFESSGLGLSVGANTKNQIYARVTDGGNAMSSCDQVGTYENDTIAPSFSAITTSPASPNSAVNFTVKGTVSPDATTVQIYGDSICNRLMSTGTAATFTSTGLASSAITLNASNTIYAKAFDAAGNISACLPIGTYIHDDTPPRVNSFVINMGATATNSANVSINSDVPTATQMAFTLAANCGGTLTYQPYNMLGAFTIPAVAGSQTVWAKFLDAAGNSSCVASSIIYDITPPTVSFTSPTDPFVLTAGATSISFSGTCSENGRAVQLGGYIVAAPVCTAGTWTYTATNLGQIADGDKIVTVNLADAAGNLAWTNPTLAPKRTIRRNLQVPRNPSVLINKGASVIASTNATLNLYADQATQMLVSASSTCATGTWETMAATKAYTLPSAGGRVFAKFRNSVGESACVGSNTVTINANDPNASPVTLLAAVLGGEEIISTNSISLVLSTNAASPQMAITDKVNCGGTQTWIPFQNSYSIPSTNPLFKPNALNDFYIQTKNASGQKSPCVLVEVYVQAEAPSDLTYDRESVFFVPSVSNQINLKPLSRGGVVDLYSITPALPSGMTLSPQTGSITGSPGTSFTGTPTSYIFTVTAKNFWGSTTTVVRFYKTPGNGQLVVTNAGTAIQNDSLSLVRFPVATQYADVANLTFDLSNSGTGSILLGAPKLALVDSQLAGFKIVSGPTEGTSLAAGAHTSLVLKILTKQAGFYQDTLTIPTNDAVNGGKFIVRIFGQVNENSNWNPIVDINDLYNAPPSDHSALTFQGSDGIPMLYFGKVTAGTAAVTKYFHVVDHHGPGIHNTQYWFGDWYSSTSAFMDDDGNEVPSTDFSYTLVCPTASNFCSSGWAPIPPPLGTAQGCGDATYPQGITPGAYDFPITFHPPTDLTASGRRHIYLQVAISWKDTVPTNPVCLGWAQGAPHVRVLKIPLVVDVVPAVAPEDPDAQWINVSNLVAQKYEAEAERIGAITTSAAFEAEITNNRLQLVDLETELLQNFSGLPHTAELKALLLTHIRTEMSSGASDYMDHLKNDILPPMAHEVFASLRASLDLVTNDSVAVKRPIILRLMNYLKGAESEVQDFAATNLLAPSLGLSTTTFNSMTSDERDLYRAGLHRTFIGTIPTNDRLLLITTQAISLTSNKSLKVALINQALAFNPAILANYIADHDILVLEQGGGN